MICLGECKPLHARISERQCNINRERKIISCEKCPGLVPGSETFVQEVDVSKRGKCVKCKRDDVTIVGRGLCGKCYGEEKSKGFPPLENEAQGKPGVSVSEQKSPNPSEVTDKTGPRSLLSLVTPPQEVKPNIIHLDFTEHPDLLANLIAISDDVSGDILELCSMLVLGKLRMVA